MSLQKIITELSGGDRDFFWNIDRCLAGELDDHIEFGSESDSAFSLHFCRNQINKTEDYVFRVLFQSWKEVLYN